MRLCWQVSIHQRYT
ncbi:hypothetical protein DW779_07135 [Clostridium sp. AM30-24]|nr:hypothetical protein DW779_07135 [Clostridium sp. AM30-24]